MKKVEMTPALMKTIQILQLRNQIDPKRYIKKNVMKGVPKYF